MTNVGRIYLDIDGKAKYTINPTEKGFRVVVDGVNKPFNLETAVKNNAEIYDAEYEPYYIISLPGNRYILRKSIHENNSNSNYENAEVLETESNVERHLAPRPVRTFGTLPSFASKGRRNRARKTRKSRRSNRKSRSRRNH
jgi:hypothetical protein